MKAGRLAGDPGDEGGELRIGTQRFDIVEAMGQLGFGEAGMDGAMADLVQAHRAQMGAALEARGQMMAAGLGLGRDGALAERADIGGAAGDGGFGRRDRLFDPPRRGPRHYPASASRSFLLSRSVSLLSCPQAAKISRPRGVRTGLA